MTSSARRDRPEMDDRKVIYLEFVAAGVIFLIVAVVLYMVFTFRPQ